MILAYLLLLTGLTISSVAIYYSVVGLTAIFSAAAIPIMIMGVSLEVAKLVCATWIKQHWAHVPRLMRTYMVVAVIALMLVTSMGIFGFLSKAHNDQTLVSGDVGSKIAIYDEKIRTARENIEADRKQLRQMDEAVDQVMGRSQDEKGADKAVAIRNSQKRDRAALAKDIESNQRIIATLNDEAAPIRAENRKVEAEVGPIKYIAAFIYGVAPDSTMLEKAVTWIIILIVVVFDPLAVIMLLASQMSFVWARHGYSEKEDWEKERQELLDNPKKFKMEMLEVPDFLKRFKDRITDRFKKAEVVEEPIEDLIADITTENVHTEVEFPYAGQGVQPSMPLSASYIQPRVDIESVEEEIDLEEVNRRATEAVEEPVINFEEVVEQAQAPLPDETLTHELAEAREREELLANFAEHQLSEIERLQHERDLLFQAHSHEMTRADELAVRLANLEQERINLPAEPEPVVLQIRPESDIKFKEPVILQPETATKPKMVVEEPIPVVEPEPQIEPVPKPVIVEAMPGRDPRTEFGNNFPNTPEKGDMYLRTDFKPNRLFKWNDTKWIEVNKSTTDAYSYNDAYIQYLAEKLFSGEYSIDDLSDVEQQQVQRVVGGRRG